jgi:integrase
VILPDGVNLNQELAKHGWCWWYRKYAPNDTTLEKLEIAYSLDQVGMAVIRTATQAQLPGVSLHTLRHTFISRLVQAGRPLPEVAALAGHRDIKMTMRYAHLAPSHLRAGIDALEQRNARHPVGPALSTEPRVTPVSQELSDIA